MYNQDRKKAVSDLSLKGLVLSIEAIRSKDNRHAGFLPAGFMNSFAVGYRVYSLEERDNNYKKDEESILTSFDLDFSKVKSFTRKASAADYLLYNGIVASNDLGRNQTYNLFSNNCTNRLFDLFDQSMQFRSNEKLDTIILKREYQKWAEDDLDDIVKFMVTYIEKNPSIPAPPQLLQLTQLSLEDIVTGKFDEEFQSEDASANPKNFLYNLPMFIKAHLEIRGLID